MANPFIYPARNESGGIHFYHLRKKACRYNKFIAVRLAFVVMFFRVLQKRKKHTPYIFIDGGNSVSYNLHNAYNKL